MKICTLTIHFGVNHGSALQAYALFKYLSQLGHDVKVIDYIPKRYNAWYSIKIKKKNHPLIVKLAYYLVTSPKIISQRRIFEQFLSENVKFTERYYSMEELLGRPPVADVYIAGSDQIWNKEYNGEDEYSYFLPFVKEDKKKIAYAASFGRSEIEKIEQDEISPYLKKFDHISVREDSGLSILKKCGINEGVTVLDPTLLLTKEDWRKFSLSINNIKDGFLLIYVMDHKYEKLIEYGDQIAKRFNLKIYVICFKKIKDRRIDVCFTNISPREFLYLFDKASYVVTNSYHGVLFSINFEKQFIAVAKEKYNTRIDSILRLMKLEDRFVYNDFYIEKAVERIDYANVSIHLHNARIKSAEFLNNALKVPKSNKCI
jgi:polysaccharide pyruvyl transferase WcaK-like protein